MTYPLKFRQKVLEVKEKENLTFKETAARFDISISNISRWQKCLEPRNTRNKPAVKINMEALKQDVEAHPDAYHYERAARFNVSERGIAKALKRLNISRKKNIRTSQS